jgi:hypothetical protein
MYQILVGGGGEDANIENYVNNFKIKLGDNYCWNDDTGRIWNRIYDLVTNPVSQPSLREKEWNEYTIFLRI